MTCTSVVPELTVLDVDRAVEFYKTVLGFELAGRAPEQGEAVWAEVSNGAARVMFQRRAEMFLEIPFLAKTPIGGTVVTVLQVSASEARQFAANLSSSVQVVLPLRETDYGTAEVAILDQDGYVILVSGR